MYSNHRLLKEKVYVLMTEREEKIEMVMKNMGYIRLGLERVIDESSERGDRECAAWLIGTMESLLQDVERKHRQQAIEARNRLNNGYTKGNH